LQLSTSGRCDGGPGCRGLVARCRSLRQD
jgi:hypothetical protein